MQNYTKTEAFCDSNYSELPVLGGRFLLFRDIPELIRQYGVGNKILDYGCGAGRSTTLLKSLGLEVDGADISHYMITTAKNRDPGGVYFLTKGTAIPKPRDFYDMVHAGFVMHYCPTKTDLVKTMKEIARVLKRGGVFMFSVSNEELFRRNDWSTVNVDFEENRHLVSGSLAKIVFREYDVTIRHYYWTDEDYREAVLQAGFNVVCVHMPLGKNDDGVRWTCETEATQVTMYVAKKQ